LLHKELEAILGSMSDHGQTTVTSTFTDAADCRRMVLCFVE
jgi:hypothetical protein